MALSEALKTLENILLINPSMERALLSKGLVLSSQGDFKQAADAFTIIIDVDPTNQRARLSRAFAYSQIKEFVKSIEDYDFVVNELGNTTGEVLYFRAIAYINLGDRAQGCADLNEAIQAGYSAAIQLEAQACN